MPKSRRRSYFLVPSFIVLCSIVAGVMGSRGVSAASPADDADQSLKAFTKVYDVVEQNFADPVKPDKGHLQGRDSGHAAHARSALQFLRSASDYAALREDQRGQYYGVGMQVQGRATARPS